MKARQKESWIKGKNNNNLDGKSGIKSGIIQKVNKIINEELIFLNKHFNYDLSQYYNCNLIYGSCFLVFFNLEEIKSSSCDKSIFLNNYFSCKKNENSVKFDTLKIINLITGFELLGIGLNVHGTSENIINDNYLKKDNLKDDSIQNSDIKYTIELLFGDIFYSRAVLYLINYGDFLVFEDIIKSLLKLHRARLIIHQKLAKFYSKVSVERINDNFIEDIMQIKDLNALLKSAFLTGLGASDFDFYNNNTCLRIIENIALLKTYNDIENKLQEIRQQIKNNNINKYLNFTCNEKKSTTVKIKNDIDLVKPEWLKNNFKNLMKLF